MSDLAQQTSSSQNASQVSPLTKNPTDHSASPYGLAVDPFEDVFVDIDIDQLEDFSAPPFFLGGDRQSVLDEVIHLTQFSNNIVAVLGEAGVGKTAFAFQAMEVLNETAQCCFIQSSVLSSAQDVLQRLAEQLGVYTPEQTTAELITAIAQYQPSGLQQGVVLIVDDAHHLNYPVLAALVALLQNQSAHFFHVLLLGDSSLLLALDELDKGEILAYDIPLCPFNVDELEQYLAFKLSAVGYQGAELFDYDSVQSIWRDTRGIPASVNRVARGLLHQHTLDDNDATKLGLPLVYMSIVVILLAALIMALFYMDDDVAEKPKQPVSSSVEPEIINKELTDQPLLEEGIINEPANTTTPDKVVDKTDQPINAQPPVVSNEPEIVVPLVEPEQSQPLALDTQPKQNITSESASVEALAAQSNPVVIEAKTNESTTITLPEKPESISPEVQVVNTPPPPAPVVTEDSLPSTTIRTLDEEAVLFWPPEGYTLQVMAAGNLSGVKRFVASQANQRLLRIVSVERNGSPWHIVLVGVYDDRAQAQSAISRLPQSQVNAKPWARSIADVQRMMNNKQ